jgi:hypothetical protein
MALSSGRGGGRDAMTDRFIRWEERDGIRSVAIDRVEKANA